jgi:hypothetical protein
VLGCEGWTKRDSTENTHILVSWFSTICLMQQAGFPRVAGDAVVIF